MKTERNRKESRIWVQGRVVAADAVRGTGDQEHFESLTLSMQ